MSVVDQIALVKKVPFSKLGLGKGEVVTALDYLWFPTPAFNKDINKRRKKGIITPQEEQTALQFFNGKYRRPELQRFSLLVGREFGDVDAARKFAFKHSMPQGLALVRKDKREGRVAKVADKVSKPEDIVEEQEERVRIVTRRSPILEVINEEDRTGLALGSLVSLEKDVNACEECGGTLFMKDPKTYETVCRKCGAVKDELAFATGLAGAERGYTQHGSD